MGPLDVPFLNFLKILTNGNLAARDRGIRFVGVPRNSFCLDLTDGTSVVTY